MVDKHVNAGAPGRVPITCTLSDPGLDHMYTLTEQHVSPSSITVPNLCSSIQLPGNDTGYPPTGKSKAQKSSLSVIHSPHPNTWEPFMSLLGLLRICSRLLHLYCCLGGSHHHFSFGSLQLVWIVSSFAFLLPYHPLCTLPSDDLPRHQSDYVIQMNTYHYLLTPTCELSFKFLSVV